MRIILVGFGSVGRAVAKLLERRAGSLYAEHGLSPRLVAVTDSRGGAISQCGLSAAELLAAKSHTGSVAGVAGHGCHVDDVASMIRNTQADVLIEAAPSSLVNPRPAFNNLRAALSSGKHAVSVNKAPLATAMPALLELARFNRVQLRYSGTVGGGTPVLATARTLAAGDRITSIRAILNGTTNFILHRMGVHGDEYPAALAEAVRLGYAETDPSADVDGFDTATKLVILANAVLGMSATVSDVSIRGIRAMPRRTIDEASARSHRIKLIGSIEESGRLAVAPDEVPIGDPLDVPANLNAVQFSLESAGVVTIVGRGAGGPETATAVLRDLVDLWHSPAPTGASHASFSPRTGAMSTTP